MKTNNTKSKPSTTKEKVSYVRKEGSPWVDDYLNPRSGYMEPMTQAGIQRLCQDLLDYAAKEDSLIFRTFLDNKCMPEIYYYRWVDKFENLREAHAMAKGMIGARRELAALVRKMDSSIVQSSMYMYDSAWKAMHDEKMRLKATTTPPMTIVANFPDITKGE